MASRSTSQARQPACEPKVNQDVSVGSKLGKSSGGANFSRGSKRREPNNGSLSGLNPNRPGPKARGAAGKRPQPRGTYRNNNTQDYEQMKLDDENELGSVFYAGHKKQNFNHLLNFQYSQRGQISGSNMRTGGGRNNNQRTPKGRIQKHQNFIKPSFNKSQYLQANCQFIVKEVGDLSVHAVDPDLLVDWSLIEQVHLKTSGSDLTSCPICLYPPTAAKISRCGHIFCWPCILHYLALSDDTSRKCPICDQSIEKSDLKSVVPMPQKNHLIGHTIEMKLMKRERNSLFASPMNNEALSEIPAVNRPGLERCFVKMLRASSAQVKDNILARERRELLRQWEEEKSQPESCFIQEALSLLAKREMEMATDLSNVALPKVEAEPINDLPAIEKLNISGAQAVIDPFAAEEEVLDNLMTLDNIAEESKTARPRHVSGNSLTSSDGDVEPVLDDGVTAADLDISTVQTNINLQEPRSVFYFYQSSDGQPIFLHALNVQMLVKEFGSLENCPETINAEILEKESTVMNEELRDRLRYLRHLPIASTFEVTELDISKLVSKQTVQCFKEQLEKRRRTRARKSREEKRREKKIKHEEARMMGFPGSMVRVESDYFTSGQLSESDQSDHFPTCTSNEIEEASASMLPDNGAISFAKICKARPTAPKIAETVPQNNGLEPTWTTLGSIQSVSSRYRPPVNQVDSEGEQEPEGYIPPPQRASLGDTLAAALQAADSSGPSNSGGKKGKKGRGKKILVTGGAPRPTL